MTRPRGRPRQNQTRDREITAMRKSGATWREIAERFGISRQAAQQSAGPGFLSPAKASALGRKGPRFPRPPVTPALLADIQRLLEAGITHSEIAKSLSVSMTTIARAKAAEQD